MLPNTFQMNIQNLREIEKTHPEHWISKLILYSFIRMEYEENSNGEMKKKAIGLMPSWSKLKESKLDKNHSCCACLTGEKSNILVLDFDDIDLYNEYVFKYKSLNNIPYVKTKKGYHLYFKWNDKYVNLPSKIGKLDIQGNGKQVYFPPTNYDYIEKHFEYTFIYEMFNYENNELTELPEDLYLELTKDKKIENIIKKEITETKDNVIDSDDDNEKIVNLISSKTLGEFEDWKKIIFAMKYEGFSEEFAKTTSERATGNFEPLTEETWIKFWNNNMDKCTMGTLRYYAKRDNLEKYKELQCNFKIFEESVSNADEVTDTYFARLYNFLKPNHIVYVKEDNTFYTWIKNKWVIDSEKGIYCRNNIIEAISNYFNKMVTFYNYKIDSIPVDSDNDGILQNQYKCAIQKFENLLKTINKTARINNCWTELKSILYKNSITQNIQFDMNPDIIGFNNKKYNFKTNLFEDIKFDDYISFSCGFNYTEPSQDEYDTINDIFQKAFPNLERRKCYLSIMYNSLIGGQKEKFCVANGTGGNSKGVINELLLRLLGDYGIEADTSVLTEKQKLGANPELAKLNKKRLIIFKEPNENDKIRCDMLKKLVGNSTLQGARDLYSSKTGIKLCGTSIFEVNVKLGFDGRLQDDIGRRLLDILFESTFTDDESILNDTTRKYVFQKNSFYTSDEFKESHKCALFKYLIDNADRNIYVPECVKEATKNYIDNNDNIYNWVLENYELTTEKQDVIKIKDMYELYKESDEYKNAYKKERKTLKSFSTEITNHKYLRSKYVEKLQDNFVKDIYGVSLMRSVLVGIKLINSDEY